jgi:hypothetical protein
MKGDTKLMSNRLAEKTDSSILEDTIGKIPPRHKL